MKYLPHKNFSSLFFELRRKMNKDAKESVLKDKLTLSQVEILWFIALSGEKKMEEIADYLSIKPPSATNLIDNMEKDNLIKREKDINDRRITNIVLTNKAKNLIKDLKKQKEFIFHKMISKLSDEDKINLERIIKIILTE